MSGHEARKGFRFQDLYLLRRVLRAASEALAEGWEKALTNPSTTLENLPVRFGLEASSRLPGQSAEILDWDVLVETPTNLELAEVKSGAVDKSDRLAFWGRLRCELRAHGSDTVTPVLVVDPDTAGELGKWEGLAEIAAASSATEPLTKPTGNVTDSNELLNEALWHLCEPPLVSGVAVLYRELARATLARFSLQKHRLAALEHEVRSLFEVLFPGDNVETYEPLLLGWLTNRASAPVQTRQLFRVRELLAEIGVLHLSAVFTEGKLRMWRTLWDEISWPVRARTKLRLGAAGQSIALSEIQPEAVALLRDDKIPAVVITGMGGAGKSTFVAQTVAVATNRGEQVLWCGADDASLEEVDEVVNAFRFRTTLLSLRNPQALTRIFVDGLDEAANPKRARWAELLSRLPGLAQARIVVSVRESIWRSDGGLRQKLGIWPLVNLGSWPEPLVAQLVNTTPYAGSLPLSVMELLRTPILLDLFWRTFVEDPRTDLAKARQLRSRHELIAAFWTERLLRSPRYATQPNVASALAAFFARAAAVVGAFTVTDSEKEAAQILLAEGVVVEAGKLQPRLNFRHPLLRDFALAQWCLGAASVKDTAERWTSIAGGLQRYGALRAMAEALADPLAATDYPAFSFSDLLRAILATSSQAAGQVTQLLGTWEVIPGLNPSLWPGTLQASLPPTFASSVVAASRLSENPLWAAAVLGWPEDAPWMDDQFPSELWQYADTLKKKAQATPRETSWTQAAQSAAQKLRELSESKRFASVFAASDGWLTMHTASCILPVLPDLPTLEWLERQMPQATWRTRSFALPLLVHLAAVDANRTAALYRDAVGLSGSPTGFHLNREHWGSLMPEQAINWSLSNEDNHRSLLLEYPATFFPVGVELAEALFRDRMEAPDSDGSHLANLIEIINPGAAKQDEASAAVVGLADLIDDLPDWGYWRGLKTGDVRQRCIRVLHVHAQAWIQKDSGFSARAILPALRKSRLGTVQSVALDLLLEHRELPAFQPLLQEAALDRRLYFASGQDYWLEQNLVFSWPRLNPTERNQIESTLIALIAIETFTDRAQTLLAQLPKSEWSADLQTYLRSLEAPQERGTPRPTYEQDEGHDIGGSLIKEDPPTETPTPGQWPDNVDSTHLRDFHEATFALGQSETTPATFGAERPRATCAALALLPIFREQPEILAEPHNAWAWFALERTLESYRRLADDSKGKVLPPPALVEECGQLAFSVLTKIPAHLPGKLPDGDLWSGFRETMWTRALDLADEALTWPPLEDDQTIQSSLETLLEQAFATKDPMLQLVCGTRLRAWHWLRTPERQRLFRRLVWETPTEPAVLQWCLNHAMRCPDRERTEIFRSILQRPGANNDELAHQLGKSLGICGLVYVSSGQRSSSAHLIREIISNRGAFLLLEDDANLRAFWRGFAFGLKEQAMRVNHVAALAADYGSWMLAAWGDLLPRRKMRNESEGVVLFALHWMSRKEPVEGGAQRLKPWWESLQPLLAAVVADGGTPDCFTLFFALHDGDFNYVASPEQLLGLVEAWTDRIIAASSGGLIDLDARFPAKEEHHSWRECADFAASTVAALHAGDVLTSDLLRERAHQLLSRLAARPLRSSQATLGLHRLQKD